MRLLRTSPHATPRIASSCARRIGWRYAMIASVSSAGCESRVWARAPFMRESTGPYAAIVSIWRPPDTLSMRKARLVSAYCAFRWSTASATSRSASRRRAVSAAESRGSAASSPAPRFDGGTRPSTSAMRESEIGRSARRIAASTRSANGIDADGSSGSSRLIAKSDGCSSADLRRRLGDGVSVTSADGVSGVVSGGVSGDGWFASASMPVVAVWAASSDAIAGSATAFASCSVMRRRLPRGAFSGGRCGRGRRARRRGAGGARRCCAPRPCRA